MELSVGIVELLKLLGKFIAHKIEQSRLATNEYEIVYTSYGKIRGMKRKNAYEEFCKYYAFEGIPYAKPPLGDLRFRAPQPPEPWNDVLDCLHYKSKPLQIDFLRRITLGSEDCLYLNVYAKKLITEKPLPVMVYIYGGGFQAGEATRELYSPDYFMQKDVVLVTIGYRLAALGFLSLNDPDLQVPGNAGLKDQIMALRWIQQNIAYFNGDPNNVTLFGESAGAASTHYLMLTPQAKGLFHKAILMSGTVLCPWACQPPKDWGFRLACLIGYKGNNNDREVYRYLAKQNASKLIVRDSTLLTKQERFDNLLFGFCPVVEPYLTKECISNRPFKDLLANAWSNDIPLIIGANSFEGLFYYNTIMKCNYLVNELTDCVNLLPDDIKSKHTEQELKQMANSLKQAFFGQKAPSIKESLFEYMDLMSYRTFWHGIYRIILARSAYASQMPTFCYVFDFDSPTFNHFRILNCGRSMRGVCHGDDVSYMFYNAMAEKLLPTMPEYKCIQRMIGMWYSFALNSNPNCKEIQPVCWQPVTNAADLQEPIKALNISDEMEFKNLSFHNKLQIWNKFYTKESLY